MLLKVFVGAQRSLSLWGWGAMREMWVLGDEGEEFGVRVNTESFGVAC